MIAELDDGTYIAIRATSEEFRSFFLLHGRERFTADTCTRSGVFGEDGAARILSRQTKLVLTMHQFSEMFASEFGRDAITTKFGYTVVRYAGMVTGARLAESLI